MAVNEKTLGKIAAIGDKDIITVFKALGMAVHYATQADEIKKTIKQLEEQNYSMIFITETEAIKVEEFLGSLNTRVYPIIFIVPDGRSQENESFSIDKIRKNMERAIGSAAALK